MRSIMQVAAKGKRNSKGQADYARWGRQRGSVYLGEQKVAVAVLRVRDLRRGQEVPLASYQALRRPQRADEAAPAHAVEATCAIRWPDDTDDSPSSVRRRPTGHREPWLSSPVQRICQSSACNNDHHALPMSYQEQA